MSNWWIPTGCTASDVVCAYKAEGAASLAASYSNLNNPGTQDAIATVPPTWNATDGWIFNGVDQYLDTGADPASTWSVICKFSGASVPGSLFGIANSTISRVLYFSPFTGRDPDESAWALGDGIFEAVSSTKTDGIAASAGFTAYFNGIEVGSILGGDAWENSGNSLTMLLACYDFLAWEFEPFVSVPNNYLLCNIQSFVLYNKTLTPEQILAVTTNIQNGYRSPTTSGIARRKRRRVGLLL